MWNGQWGQFTQVNPRSDFKTVWKWSICERKVIFYTPAAEFCYQLLLKKTDLLHSLNSIWTTKFNRITVWTTLIDCFCKRCNLLCCIVCIQLLERFLNLDCLWNDILFAFITVWILMLAGFLLLYSCKCTNLWSKLKCKIQLNMVIANMLMMNSLS